MSNNFNTRLQELYKAIPGLATLVGSINKAFGDNTIMWLGQTPQAVKGWKCWRTGLYALDQVIGNSGFVKGRFIEIYGPESSGKTTLALNIIANIQRHGGIVAYIDGEHTLDPVYARRLGVDVDALLISQPDNGAVALNIVDTLVRSCVIDAVIVDSVPSLIPEGLAKKDIGDPTIGLLPRLLGPASKIINNSCAKSETSVIWINQVREVINVGFAGKGGQSGGVKLTRPGGREFRHNLSYAIELTYVGAIKDSEGNRIGHNSQIKVTKNKTFPPFRVTVMQTYYEEDKNLWGFCEAADLYRTGMELGLINVSGTKKTFAKKMTLDKYGNGELNSIRAINDSEDIKELMRKTIDGVLEYDKQELFNSGVTYERKAKVDVAEIEVNHLTQELRKDGIDITAMSTNQLDEMMALIGALNSVSTQPDSSVQVSETTEQCTGHPDIGEEVQVTEENNEETVESEVQDAS